MGLRRRRLVGSGVLGGGGFNPAAFGTPVVWLKMGAGRYTDAAKTTLATTGQLVYAWANQILGGPDFVQATEGARPLCEAGGGITLDGNDNLLIAASAVTVGTVFVVANYTKAAAFATFDGLITGSTSTDANVLLLGNGTGAVLTTFYNALIQYYFYGRIEVNNVATLDFAPMGTIKLVAGYPAATDSKTLQLGKDRANASRFWGGVIREVIVYSNILSAGDRSSAADAIMTRHGLV